MTDLGTFENLPILGHTLKVVNTGDGLSKARAVSPTEVHAGDNVDLVMRTVASNVTMKLQKDDNGDPIGWNREQTLSCETVAIVNDEVSSAAIGRQRDAEEAARIEDEKKRGIERLPLAPLDKGDRVTFDSDGNHVLPGDIAEMRGLGKVLRSFKPAVVVLSDGQRNIWPDEYNGAPRPVIGQLGAGDESIVVTALLDQVTGDPVDDLESAGDDLTPEPSADSEPELPEETAFREIFNDRTGEPLPAGWDDPDPAVTAFLAGSPAEVKLRCKGQLSAQLLKQALEVEQAGVARLVVVGAIEDRLATLAAK